MNLNGIQFLPSLLDRSTQEELLEKIRDITAQAPLFTPRMPRTGKEMSVRMTNCGPLGWVTDKEKGYRYQSHHPETKQNWPEIPLMLQELWQEYSGFEKPAEACLINYYEPTAKMGLHQDKDENTFDAPVFSLSLGDTCLFRMGGLKRNDATTSMKLAGGDAVLLSGASRLIYHGVDRIYPSTSTLLKTPGRINLTMRRVNP